MKYIYLLIITLFGSIFFQIIYCFISGICMLPCVFLMSKFCNSKFNLFCKILLILTTIISSSINSFYVYFLYSYIYKYFNGDNIIFNILTLFCCYIISTSGFVYLTKNDPTPINQATTGWLMIALLILSVVFYFTQSIYLVLIPFVFQIPIMYLSYAQAKTDMYIKNKLG